MARAAAAVTSVAAVAAFLPYQNPPNTAAWNGSNWNGALSSISMACNSSGEFNVTLGSQFGIISFDWSNEKAEWAATKPMDCEERMVTQAVATKLANPQAHVFVYRNLVKALPWFTTVREKLEDPAYADWFLKFAPGVTPHVPKCDAVRTSLCSEFYHDQEQTPAVPSPSNPSPDGACVDYCDCGNGIPCGEYVWDLRNASLRTWLVDEFILGDNGMGNGAISGFFIDDFWCSNLINGTGACTDPVQGPTEMDAHAVQDMGLTDADVANLTLGWLDVMTRAQAAILSAGGYTWSLIPQQDNADASPMLLPSDPNACAAAVRPSCGPNNPFAAAPLMFGVTPGANWSDPMPQVAQDAAAFLLMRGPYAYWGWGVWGMSWPAGVAWANATQPLPRPPLLEANYGAALAPCAEAPSGVFTRQYENAIVQLNCNTFTANITALE